VIPVPDALPEVLRAVETWVGSLPEPATAERVRDNFWYVRIPGTARSWIPFEIDVGERSVKVTSHVIIEPDENHKEVYDLLLRHNHRAAGSYFSIDGKEGVICLVNRIPLADFDEFRLDEIVGSMIDETETTFRTILNLGFASRMKKR
jgi:hypothetical protein